MQLFIIHFLILPIKKFKKQKLKIIFFNFLNKCNRYNIYCVSYYKGNLGKLQREPWKGVVYIYEGL